jgi:hypothetical protein
MIRSSSRRRFLCTLASAAVPWALPATGRRKPVPLVRAAFLYTPTALLQREGYYSWPGAGFDAEGRQRQYAARIAEIAAKLNVAITLEPAPLYGEEPVARFIREVKSTPCDGLLLVAFKKSEWEAVRRIVRETGIRTAAVAPTGVLLTPNINDLYSTPGVYAISSLDNFGAIEFGLRMLGAARAMKESRILSIAGTKAGEAVVEHLGTRIRIRPMEDYAAAFRATEVTPEVEALARDFRRHAKACREPSWSDILDAARAHVALQRLVQQEEADAVMMQCLEGIREKQIPPPCMSFMRLRDTRVPAGCQNDLNATLTLMLVQQLFDKPGFQQNASCESESNHYFGAHCTSPTRLSGPEAPPAPYVLRNHAEAGAGCVPQVLWPAGQDVTMAHYLSGAKPEMLVYSGKIVRCYEMPPAGGCRTNLEMTINELDDACGVKSMHQTIFLGNHARQLRRFCQLWNIPVVT